MPNDEPLNLTTQVLIDIRDEMRGMREELSGLRDETHAGFAAVHADLAGVHAELSGLHEDVSALREDVSSLRNGQQIFISRRAFLGNPSNVTLDLYKQLEECVRRLQETGPAPAP